MIDVPKTGIICMACKPEMEPQQAGRFQIEVHPHAASVNLFALPRIVKYKRGKGQERAEELNRFRKLWLDHLLELQPAVSTFSLPKVASKRSTRKWARCGIVRYLAAHWWYWDPARNQVVGDGKTGFIIVPNSLR